MQILALKKIPGFNWCESPIRVRGLKSIHILTIRGACSLVGVLKIGGAGCCTGSPHFFDKFACFIIFT